MYIENEHKELRGLYPAHNIGQPLNICCERIVTVLPTKIVIIFALIIWFDFKSDLHFVLL